MQNNGKINTNTGATEFQHVSAFRRILPQVLASFVKHLLILDLAISMSFPAVLIPQLTGVRNRAPDEILYLNDMQASWFGTELHRLTVMGIHIFNYVKAYMGTLLPITDFCFRCRTL